MLAKFVCAAVLVAYVCDVTYGYKKDEKYPVEEPPAPFYEEPCMTRGGICLKKNECPKGKQAVEGLCPLQQDHGVECCFSVAKSSSTCRAHGGECIPSSTQWPEDLIYSEATDCGHNEKCGILVN